MLAKGVGDKRRAEGGFALCDARDGGDKVEVAGVLIEDDGALVAQALERGRE